MDDMVVDVLLDERNAERDLPIPSLWRLALEPIKKGIQLGSAFGMAQVSKIQLPVLGEEVRDVSEFPLVDILVVAVTQVADRLAVAELLHLSLQLLDPCFGILCHSCPLL